jgi:hypothetical protein
LKSNKPPPAKVGPFWPRVRLESPAAEFLRSDLEFEI